jgi:hypothetical protein
MDAASWIAASTRRVPEHSGQTNTAIPSPRCNNSAQEHRRRPPRRLPHHAEPAAALAPGCCLPFQADGWQLIHGAIFMIVPAEFVHCGLAAWSYRRGFHA